MADRSKTFQIARRYANAIFGLLNEKERITFSIECDDFLIASTESFEVNDFLKNPLFGVDAKTKVLKKVFPKSVKIKHIDSFFGLLCQKKREIILPAFCETFQEKVFAEQGKALCVVTTAREVGKSVIKSIETRISKQFKKELVMKTKIDPKILGGFKAEVGGTVLDGSLRSQLDALRSNMLSAVKR